MDNVRIAHTQIINEYYMNKTKQIELQAVLVSHLYNYHTTTAIVKAETKWMSTRTQNGLHCSLSHRLPHPEASVAVAFKIKNGTTCTYSFLPLSLGWIKTPDSKQPTTNNRLFSRRKQKKLCISLCLYTCRMKRWT